MKQIGKDELKGLQLEILVAVDKFCRENDIKYSLGGGTLIGAVRHKGYIPWDDDIDVYLLRKDYKRLVELFPHNHEGKFDISSLERDSYWARPYAKCYNNKTIIIEEVSWGYRLGVNIDIFPIDDVPDDKLEWERYNKCRVFLLHLFRCRHASFKGKRSFIKGIVVFGLKLLTLPIPVRTFAKLLNKYAQKYNNIGCSYVFTNSMGLRVKNRYLKCDFDKVVETDFEGRKFLIMKGYDDCLKSLYGNYMTLPSKEKQVSHHLYKAWWKE